jgi:hypothetical protein
MRSQSSASSLANLGCLKGRLDALLVEAFQHHRVLASFAHGRVDAVNFGGRCGDWSEQAKPKVKLVAQQTAFSAGRDLRPILRAFG